MLLDRSLITRTSLQDVGRLLQFSEAQDWDGFRQYSNTCDPVSLVFLDNINAVWSKSSKIKLPDIKSVKVIDSSLLHRWWLIFNSVGFSGIDAVNIISGIDYIQSSSAYEYLSYVSSVQISAAEAMEAELHHDRIVSICSEARLLIQVLSAIQDYLPEPLA